MIEDVLDRVLLVRRIVHVAVIVDERLDIGFAHVLAVPYDAGASDVLAVWIYEHVGPVLKVEADAGVIVEVLLEAGAHGGERVDERHLVSIGQIGQHVHALELRPHDLVIEQVLDPDVLDGIIVVLRCQLSVRDSLDGIREGLAQDVLRGALAEILAPLALDLPFVDALVLREQAVELMMVRALLHLGLGGLELADLLLAHRGLDVVKLDVPLHVLLVSH